MATLQTNSIVDYLKQQGLPSDRQFRGKLFESLGLGSMDEYNKGTLTGATNVKLLQHLNNNPDLAQKVVSLVKSGQSLSGLTAPAPVSPPAPPAGGQNPANPNQLPPPSSPIDTSGKKDQSSLPSTIDDINKFQQDYAGQFTESKSKLESAISDYEKNKPLTLDEILKEQQEIKNKLGIDKLEKDYTDLVTSAKNIEGDIRKEVQSAGGIATESQIKALAAERAMKLKPELDRVTTELGTKSAMAEFIAKRLETSRSDAQSRAEKLIALYQGNVDKAYQAIFNYYKESNDLAKEMLKNAKEEKGKVLELSLKYPRSGINIAGDDLVTAYRKALPEAREYSELKELSTNLNQALLQQKINELSSSNALLSVLMAGGIKDPNIIYSLPLDDKTRQKLIGGLIGMGVDIPVQLTPEQQSQVAKSPEGTKLTTLRDLQNSLKAYKDLVNKHGLTFTGAAKNEIESAYADLKIKYKEAANLGALTGPDIEVLAEGIKPSTGAKGIGSYALGGGKEGVLKGLAQIEGRIKQDAQGYAKQLTSGNPQIAQSEYVKGLIAPFIDAPAGSGEKKIRVRLKNGKVGTIPESKFDPSKMTKL